LQDTDVVNLEKEMSSEIPLQGAAPEPPPPSPIDAAPTATFDTPRWQAWLERTDGDVPRSKPIAIVRPGRRYLVVLHLGSEPVPGADSRELAPDVKDTLDREQDQASFEVTLLPDPQAFDFATPSKPLPLELVEGKHGKEARGTVALEVETERGLDNRWWSERAI
jgi:hypothetical protein